MSVVEAPPLGRPVRVEPTGRVITNVLASEWTKLRSVRSTYWTLLAAAVLTIGLSAIVCAVYVAQYAQLTAKDRIGFNAASTSLTGGILASWASIPPVRLVEAALNPIRSLAVSWAY